VGTILQIVKGEVNVMKTVRHIAGFGLLLTLLLGAYLVAWSMEVPQQIAPSLNEHADFMQILIGSLVSMTLFLILWILTGIKNNQAKQFTMIEAIGAQVATLQGEHNVMKNLCAAFTKLTDLKLR
jgi:hypothetical protein